MTAAWPETLPQFVLEQGYDESLPDNSVESTMEDGTQKARRRFTHAWRPLSVTIRCTPQQAEDFEAFYFDTVKVVLPFTWVHPVTQEPGTFRFRKPVPKKRPGGSGGYVDVSFSMWQIA